MSKTSPTTSDSIDNSIELTDDELEDFRTVADGDGPAAEIAAAVLNHYSASKEDNT